MNILLVSRRYWPAVGGVETFLREIARELGQRHTVTVLTHRVDDGSTDRLTDSLRPPPPFKTVPRRNSPGRTPADLGGPPEAAMAPLIAQVVPGLRRYAFGQMRLPLAALYARVVAPVIARHGGADVVHMWGGDLVAWAAMRSARRLGVPGVITPFAHPNQYGTGPADASAYRMAERVVALLRDGCGCLRRTSASRESESRSAASAAPASNPDTVRALAISSRSRGRWSCFSVSGDPIRASICSFSRPRS